MEMTGAVRDGAALAQAIRGASPCDCCRYAADCAAEQMACGDFRVYVDTGRVRVHNRAPSRWRYRLLFPED